MNAAATGERKRKKAKMYPEMKETCLLESSLESRGKSSGVEKIWLGERPVYIHPRSEEVKENPWFSGELISHTG